MWVGRRYDGSRYVTATLAAADDERPADGAGTLDFSQAQEAAQRWFAEQERRAAGLTEHTSESYTVARCMEDYLAWFELHRRGLVTARGHVRVHILPSLGKRPVAKLTTLEIRRWHEEIAKTPARRRSAKGKPARYARIQTPEDLRKRKHTANHALATLRAALNMAYREGKVSSDHAWRRVKPFKGVNVPKVVFLESEEVRRLLNACDPSFRRLVLGALLTGCRYGELCRLRVRNFHPGSASVFIEDAKSGKSRHVFLSDEGAGFFASLTAGRPSTEPVFQHSDGTPWGRAHQTRRMEEACRVAKIEPVVSFHILRHTYASHYLMNGGSLPALAKQLGHSDTRMTTLHYGHLADQWRAEEARRHAPSFGLEGQKTIAVLGRRPPQADRGAVLGFGSRGAGQRGK